MLIRGDKMVIGVNVQSPAEEYIAQGSLTAATGTGVGAMLSIQNLTGQDLIITDVYLDITTASTGAANMNMGVDALGTTSRNNVFDALAMNAFTGVRSNHRNGGTAGGSPVWPSTHFVVATATATMAGLVGRYYIAAIPRPR